LTKQIIENAAKQAHHLAVTPDQQGVLKTYEQGGMGQPAGPDANLGVTPPPPGPPAPPRPTSVPSLTSGVPGEPPGVPSSNVRQSAIPVVTPPAALEVPKGNVDTAPISPLIEKEIQSSADQYVDVLRRNTHASEEYLKEAKKNFIDQQRGYYILNGIK
jgi:hypothetical protein